MKIIKYQLATEVNHGTPEEPDIETVLSGVTMPLHGSELRYRPGGGISRADYRGGRWTAGAGT